ncbi:MAG TPA: TolC family protein, partial [Thermoanaerobaculia bacterium]
TVARLLTLLDLPVDTEVPFTPLPEETAQLTIGRETTPPASHPAIVALQTESQRAKAEIALANADLRPDVDVEAQYGFRRAQRDMFSVVARIELPLRSKTLVEPRVREAVLRHEAAESAIEEMRRAIAIGMTDAVAAHDSATEQMRFHHEVLVPQAQLAFESTLAAYQTGKAQFDAILDTEAAYLELRLQYVEFLADHVRAIVNYEALRDGARGSL